MYVNVRSEYGPDAPKVTFSVDPKVANVYTISVSLSTWVWPTGRRVVESGYVQLMGIVTRACERADQVVQLKNSYIWTAAIVQPALLQLRGSSPFRHKPLLSATPPWASCAIYVLR